jgi:hypothetical protein
MLEAVRFELENYKKQYRRSDFPDLKLSGLYALCPDETGDVVSDWDKEWPNSRDAGVYFIFDSSVRLLYIGKASMNDCIGDRLSAHFPSDKATKTCSIVGWNKEQQPMYVATVAVPEDMKFEAAALEEYLIGKLPTVYNVRGIPAWLRWG